MDSDALIRVFDTLTAAENARNALLAGGIDGDDVELRSTDDGSGLLVAARDDAQRRRVEEVALECGGRDPGPSAPPPAR